MSGHAHDEAASDADVIRAVLDRVWCGDKVIGIEILNARDALARLTVDTPGQHGDEAIREAIAVVRALSNDERLTMPERAKAAAIAYDADADIFRRAAGVSGGTPPSEPEAGLGGDGGPVAVDTAASDRKRPVVVAAVQWTGENWDEMREFLGKDFLRVTVMNGGVKSFRVRTLEGGLDVTKGDWIIRGVKGEHYPCKPDIFAATYEPAESAGGTPTGSARLPEPDLLAAFGRAQYEADAEKVLARAEAAERERDEAREGHDNAIAAQLDFLTALRDAEARVGLLEEALRAADRMLERHDLWCGHRAEAPGDSAVNDYERARRALAGVETGPGKEHGNTGDASGVVAEKGRDV